jgi:multidrug efflux system membrane fusion protein
MTESEALVVPSMAVQTGHDGPYVYRVAADQTVELRPVTVARVVGHDTVIKDGVDPGDTVVTDGHLRLIPGSRISVRGADAAKPTS